jgi:hypothetical protein
VCLVFEVLTQVMPMLCFVLFKADLLFFERCCAQGSSRVFVIRAQLTFVAPSSSVRCLTRPALRYDVCAAEFQLTSVVLSR